MRRMLVLLTISAMAVMAAFPAGASAHTMSEAKARQAALQYVKRQVPGATGYNVFNCGKQSAHGWRCSITATAADGRTCGNRVLVRYVSPRSRRIRVRELGNAVCN